MTTFRQGQQGGRYPPPNPSPTQTAYPVGYLQGSYFDDKGVIKCELLTTRAEQLAKTFGNAGIASTQLRQFFVQVRSIERQIGQRQFAELIPRIQRLSALVAYFAGRGKSPDERNKREIFKRFIDENRVIAEKIEKNFKLGFVPHFEAIVAYYKFYFPGKD